MLGITLALSEAPPNAPDPEETLPVRSLSES